MSARANMDPAAQLAFGAGLVLVLIITPLTFLGIMPVWLAWAVLAVALVLAFYAIAVDNRRRFRAAAEERLRREREDGAAGV